MAPGALDRYARGTPHLEDPGEALGFAELLDSWDEAARRFDAGLAALTADDLKRSAADLPGGDPDSTVRSLLTTILFHQAYHAGQLGLLRRLVGKEGAIS